MKGVLHNHDPTLNLPVCIIGAGVAGLYTAMIFESLGIPYQIVDADTKDRVGGRLFTYYFPDGGPYDYYDVGAMRFPETPFMKRTFDPARNRGLPVDLIPYVMQMVEPSPNTFLFYNNARVNNGDPSISGDPFNVSGYLNDPNLTTPAEVSQRVAEVLQPFRDLFRAESGSPPRIASAMDKLFVLTNKFSMRSYMFDPASVGMNAKDISWCETLDFSSTAAYDRALTESTLQPLSTAWPSIGPLRPFLDPNHTDALHFAAKDLRRFLRQCAQEAVQFQSPVTAISEDTENNRMNISINGIQSPQSYSAVISTVPLPRLSLVDLTGVNINANYGQWSAIRELQYGPAVKVGIKFSSPWWETELPQPIHGGQSHTDLPLRTVVYPSYPKGATPENMSKVLIASYCWTQDAERLGALVNTDGTARPELIDLVFHDLAAVHGVTVEWLQQFYNPGDYFAWDWLHDPLTMGAFAFFGPGVYDSTDIYSEMLLPAANGKLFFAGEATSACHAWVAGALDSAWRAVDQYLSLNQPDSVRQTFWDLWGPTEYWDEASDEELVNLNRKLADRHLVIGLHKSGIRLS
ncbi:amine oxidase [Thelephora ganbajun]|uniref:Amine oxidase n=1 Tax=Thelephora ganbajun TaxID=370292 RepID=A0ACB6Z6F3_THEGA|nr:amine oxidase [Thelephora ganbajun]